MDFEEYKYAGQDCTCSAYGQHECACDADWTDPEVYRLQARINELEQWIAAIADDHPQIPDWIQQSAKCLLAQESE